MEGFLNLHWARWKRVLLTRCIAIVPTLALAVFADLREMTSLNDYLNAVMSLQLPFALIPVLTFTSSSRIMGQFANGIVTKVVISLLVVVIIAINFFFVGSTISSALPNAHWAVYTAIGLVAALYLLLVVYTCVHLLVALDLPGFHRLPVSRSSVSLIFFRFFCLSSSVYRADASVCCTSSRVCCCCCCCCFWCCCCCCSWSVLVAASKCGTQLGDRRRRRPHRRRVLAGRRRRRPWTFFVEPETVFFCFNT